MRGGVKESFAPRTNAADAGPPSTLDPLSSRRSDCFGGAASRLL
jgi:hypothetical protein